MNQTKEQAEYDLFQYASNYFRGLEDDSATGKNYAEHLSAIKRAYSTIHRTKASAGTPANTTSEKLTLAVAAVGVLAWFIIFHMMEDNFNLRAVYIIVLCIAFHLTTRNTFLSIVPFFIHFIGAFFNFTDPLVLAHLLCAAGYAVFQCAKKVRAAHDVTAAYTSAKNMLLRLQKELTEMLPLVRRDLQAFEQRWFAENQALLTPDDHKDFMGDFFPPSFWWQVSLDDLEQFNRIFTCNNYGDWETKLVPRDPGTEFDGLQEYTPLFHQNTTVEGKLSDLYSEAQGFMVCDIISRLTILSAKSQTVQYQVPAHSDLDCFAAQMDVISLASSVDRAYADRQISQTQRDALANDVFGLAYLAAEYSEETKTDNRTEYIPIHNHANFWTGQVALKPFDSSGTTCYVIEYYTCQLPHMLENLKALHSINIAGIDFNAWDCNPYFLAEFYSQFPNAM